MIQPTTGHIGILIPSSTSSNSCSGNLPIHTPLSLVRWRDRPLVILIVFQIHCDNIIHLGPMSEAEIWDSARCPPGPQVNNA